MCAVIGFGCFWWWRCGQPSTTYLIVRHADRLGSADALSPDLGEARRQELVHVFAAEIAGIYHSDTARSRLTGEPIATALGITPVEIPLNDVAALSSHRGEPSRPDRAHRGAQRHGPSDHPGRGRPHDSRHCRRRVRQSVRAGALPLPLAAREASQPAVRCSLAGILDAKLHVDMPGFGTYVIPS